jgi:gamma-glutamyl-gamma-aminobutyrate hydrolase PuuD
MSLQISLLSSLQFLSERQELREYFDPRWHEVLAPHRVNLVSRFCHREERLALVSDSSLVILPGGGDLSVISNAEHEIKRDETDLEVLKHCSQNQISILGICRGAQFLNSHFEGELVDLAGHVGVSHTVRTERAQFEVNSFHDRAISKGSLASSFHAVAIHEESQSVEAFSTDDGQVLGILWHPERVGVSDLAQDFFREFAGI